MCHYNEKELLSKRLKGQKLVIPDMRPIFAHWPRGQNENYQAMKDMIDERLATQSTNEENRRAFNDANPALLAATWWPTSSKDHYRILIDLIMWFGYWDDLAEKLTHDPNAAEELRSSTKTLVRQALSLGDTEEEYMAISNPLILDFKSIAEEICKVYDEEQRRSLLTHFDRYIDSTRLEAEAHLSEKLPSLKRYWEVRILTSGMGALLAFTEFAAQVKLPSRIVSSTAYETLWMTTIVINSIVNDLVSFKKEMRAGSVLSSVAILYQQVDNLDAAVHMSLAHLRILVEEFDRTANTILSNFPLSIDEVEAVSKVIDALRMVNTGNLEWRFVPRLKDRLSGFGICTNILFSLQSKRYGIDQFRTHNGQIELVL
ncbi:terpenoid synthase [Hypoxylon sp. FL0890]|nr:terpenoid synthase [Hypoxylon sp. FL0890]